MKIAMILSNPCAPDGRVTKEAEALAACGHDVRVYCFWRRGLPEQEQRNGVTYIRCRFWLIDMATRLLGFWT